MRLLFNRYHVFLLSQLRHVRELLCLCGDPREDQPAEVPECLEHPGVQLYGLLRVQRDPWGATPPFKSTDLQIVHAFVFPVQRGPMCHPPTRCYYDPVKDVIPSSICVHRPGSTWPLKTPGSTSTTSSGRPPSASSTTSTPTRTMALSWWTCARGKGNHRNKSRQPFVFSYMFLIG